MLSTPEFWVAVSFVLFVALVIYMGVPGKIAARARCPFTADRR